MDLAFICAVVGFPLSSAAISTHETQRAARLTPRSIIADHGSPARRYAALPRFTPLRGHSLPAALSYTSAAVCRRMADRYSGRHWICRGRDLVMCRSGRCHGRRYRPVSIVIRAMTTTFAAAPFTTCARPFAVARLVPPGRSVVGKLLPLSPMTYILTGAGAGTAYGIDSKTGHLHHLQALALCANRGFYMPVFLDDPPKISRNWRPWLTASGSLFDASQRQVAFENRTSSRKGN